MPRHSRPCWFALFACLSVAQANPVAPPAAQGEPLHWTTGTIRLPGGKIDLQLPDGFRYLDTTDARYVLETVWGNPPGQASLGMVFGPGQDPYGDSAWGVFLSYEEDGHIDDRDAVGLDYDQLLRDLQTMAQQGNLERTKNGFAPVRLIGWAERPSYNARANSLVWAKELDFGNPEHTLNYSVRLLGREGVLNLNAVSPMRSLNAVKSGMAILARAAHFTQGNRYGDFHETTDHLAEVGIANLVAGGAKVATRAVPVQWASLPHPTDKRWLALLVVGALAAGKFWRSRKSAKNENTRSQASNSAREAPET
jgi:uncharacterized membrane-anchored protein